MRGDAHDTRTQLGRYFVVGTTAFAIDLTVLGVLHDVLDMSVLLAGALAFVVGVSVNYALAIRWVFPSRVLGDKRWLEFAAYVSIGLVGLGINELILWGLAQRHGIHYAIAKGVSGLVVLVWTYVARRSLLFRSGSEPKDRDRSRAGHQRRAPAPSAP
jgi:putative flippase GtrA